MSYWNPSDKAAEFVLSGGNRIATRDTGTGAWRLGRAITGLATGASTKKYFEIELLANGSSGGGSIIAGIAPSTLATSTYPGSSTTSYSLQPGNTTQRNYYNNSAATALPALSAIVAGERMMVAIDLSTRKLWFGTKGTWSGNPSLGTGEVATIAAGTYYPALGMYDNPASAKLYSDGSFLYSVPSGFTSWDVDATPKKVSLKLIDRNGSPRANLSGLQWAFFENSMPSTLVTPFAKGNTGTTDSTGIISISVTGTLLNIGQIGFLVVSNTDGTIGNSIAFAGPITVIAA